MTPPVPAPKINVRAIPRTIERRNAAGSAGLTLLESDGATTLSLRQVAERAGLSRRAPYNHFASNEAMLAQMVRQGFKRLATVLSDAAQAPDQHALTDIGAAYIGFGQNEPGLFKLTFSRDLVDLSAFPDAKAADDACQQIFQVVARIARHADLHEVSMACWCIVHGYTTLCIETRLETPDHRLARAKPFARIVEADIAALRLAARI